MNTPNATTSCDPLRSRGEARRNRCYVSYWRITMKLLPPCIMAAILPIGYPLQSNWELFSAGAVPVRTTPGHSVATLRCAPEHLARALVLRGGNSMKKAPGSGPRSGERVGMDGAPDVLDEGMKTEVLGRFFLLHLARRSWFPGAASRVCQREGAQVGAYKAPPLRVAPASGDLVVGRGDHCNCTTLVEAVLNAATTAWHCPRPFPDRDFPSGADMGCMLDSDARPFGAWARLRSHWPAIVERADGCPVWPPSARAFLLRPRPDSGALGEGPWARTDGVRRGRWLARLARSSVATGAFAPGQRCFPWPCRGCLSSLLSQL